MAEHDSIDRLSQIARRLVGDVKTVAVAAADRIDTDTYTAEVMSQTASMLAGIVTKAWVDVTGIALDQPDLLPARGAELAPLRLERPPGTEPLRFSGNGLGSVISMLNELANSTFHRGLTKAGDFVDPRVPDYATVVTDHMTTVLRRGADQVRSLVDDAAEQFDTVGYGPDDWAKTMTKLGDAALLNGTELVTTAVVGPGRYETEPIVSDEFTVVRALPDRQHRLEIASPLSLAGGGPMITEDCVAFDPADCLLPPGANVFRLRVRATGAPSGIYLGTVWAIPLNELGTPTSNQPVQDEVVPVIVGL